MPVLPVMHLDGCFLPLRYDRQFPLLFLLRAVVDDPVDHVDIILLGHLGIAEWVARQEVRKLPEPDAVRVETAECLLLPEHDHIADAQAVSVEVLGRVKIEPHIQAFQHRKRVRRIGFRQGTGIDQNVVLMPDALINRSGITAFQQAGIPVKDNGATYTGNMWMSFLKTGFADVTAEVNLRTGAGLMRGDVLLNEAHHTALYIGEGMEAEASINEQGGAVGGEPGDQTGKEVLIRPFRNYPWDMVLRYRSTREKATVKSKHAMVTVPYVRKGNTGAMVYMIQMALNLVGNYGLDVDGEFGPATDRAVRVYQDSLGKTVNGIAGATTFKALMDEIAKRTYVS